MKYKKIHTFRIMVLIALLVFGTVSCTSTYVPISESPDLNKTMNTSTPALPNSNKSSDVLLHHPPIRAKATPCPQ